MLNEDKFEKRALVTTPEGKSLVSTYLAKHISEINVKRNIAIIIDSELHLVECVCDKPACICRPYTKPLKADFTKNGYQEASVQQNIQQCKGEAEMAQVDWVVQVADKRLLV